MRPQDFLKIPQFRLLYQGPIDRVFSAQEQKEKSENLIEGERRATDYC